MVPKLITPPALPVVTLAELKAHLRVDYATEDALIQTLGDAATGHLDGWRGVMGRGIKAQTWQAEYRGECAPFLLPMPDATVTAVLADDVAVTTYTTRLTSAGLVVEDVAGDVVKITFTVELPAQQLPLAQAAVKLLVGHWFANREAVGKTSVLPMAVDAMIDPLRWGRF